MKTPKTDNGTLLSPHSCSQLPESITRALRHARLSIGERRGYRNNEEEERDDICGQIDEIISANDERTRGANDNQTTSESPSCDAACSPSSIYLQVFGDSEDTKTPIPDESWGEVTWCRDQIFAGDVRYVRWDLVERLLTDIMAQHADPCSPWYNDCEKAGERCQWCEWASGLFPENDQIHPR